MSRVIAKKVYSRYFDKIVSGEKTYELRLADWDCAPGDVLELVDVADDTHELTGRVIRRKVGTVVRTKDTVDFWTPEEVKKYGYQVIGLLPEPAGALDGLQKRAQEIRQKYNELNAKDGHGTWGGKEYAMGFVGDVGELLEIIMAKENLRRGENVDARLAHELADCLWSVLVIANHYGVDLEKEFLSTMDSLEQRVAAA
ncbi:MAG TPA: DUF3850 domain-containing protein [Candidatus Saccharimonadales bacterium]|jgi:NTP pyrophosphatase (non-canonical NTP hydrolase)